MKDTIPDYYLTWPGRSVGRFWKRMLSKARRRKAKMNLRGIKYKTGKKYESECNYKTY